MAQIPPTPQPGVGVRPHRGTMILVFGIVGIVCCAIFGIVAWVMGNSDLQAMATGQMDPEGESLTKVGKILGMIAVAIWILAVILQIVAMVVGFTLIPMTNP